MKNNVKKLINILENREPHYNYKDSAELSVIVEDLEEKVKELKLEKEFKIIISMFKSFIDARE